MIVQAMRQALAAYHNGAWDEAVELCRCVLNTQAENGEALNLLGIIAAQSGRLDEAADLLERVARLKSADPQAHCNYGNVLRLLNRFDEALESYARALEIKPTYAEAYANFGNLLTDLRRYDDALESYERALQHGLRSADIHYNIGNALKALTRHEAALRSYERALSIRPDHASAHSNRGAVLKELGRVPEALASYDRALKIDPNLAETYFNRGQIFLDQAQYEAAIDSYNRAVALKPGLPFLLGAHRHARMQICDWAELESDLARIAAGIMRDEPLSPPWPLLTLIDSAPLQSKAAGIWMQKEYPSSRALPAIPKHPRRERIRLAYFSADFRDHPTSTLTAQLFELHGRSQLEVCAFSFGPDTQDPMRKRLEKAFDRFIDVRGKSDAQIALLAREMGIDIAVDLGGFTAGSRTGIFALRAAPIQISYLGYPGTMGADYIDYLIADRTVVPETSACHYREKLILLPGSYQANDSSLQIADRSFGRHELGLPPAGFVFCCFNQNYKITPQLFDIWMRLLHQVEGSVLWLLEGNKAAASNLRREAEARRVLPSRLVFAGRIARPEHLARQRAADLFLDTLPCNAHTTASDALRAGLPVLTRTGESFAARVAASLLMALGLDELITATWEEYESLAIELARDPARLTGLRNRLSGERLGTSLLDTERLARYLDSAFAQLYDRYQADLPPDHIHVIS